MGWGDLSSYGHPRIKTPNLDQLAADGVRLTSFYVTSPVCAPSRASLLTGRWAVRTGIPWNPPLRLNDGEMTIADALRAKGYATGMVGKWHVGWEPQDMPIHHGFDSYFGIPGGAGDTNFVRGDQVTDDGPKNLDLITERYTEEACAFIRAQGTRPFFLYLAHHSPHTPHRLSGRFVGTSEAGLYGDVIEELDWSVGEVVRVLGETGALANTVIVFTSDNGPEETDDGSAGPYSGWKGWIGEGGVRVPAIVRHPQAAAGGRVIDEPASTLDLFPTFLAMAGGTLPTDRAYDGGDIGDVLAGRLASLPGPGIDGHRELLFWMSHRPAAIRSGRWKYIRKYSNNSQPAVHDLATDPSELQNLWPARTDLADTLEQRIEALVAGL
jgi:arylsulfatase A-like enzyme